MPARSAPWPQAALSASAFAAAAAHGGAWLGLAWRYDIAVAGRAFELGPEFPLGLLAAVLMATAASLAAGDGRARLGTALLGLGAGLGLASALWLLLVWAPSGAPPSHLGLLRDLGRLGFALLALGLPLAMPRSASGAARGAALLAGFALTPVLLFPRSVEAVGFEDAGSTLPMLLFAAQGLLALRGASGHRLRLPRRRGSADPEASWMRARTRRRRGGAHAESPAPRPALAFEPLQEPAPPEGPGGPEGPRPPLPQERARRPPWFYQF